jgi:hypothetical protein
MMHLPMNIKQTVTLVVLKFRTSVLVQGEKFALLSVFYFMNIVKVCWVSNLRRGAAPSGKYSVQVLCMSFTVGHFNPYDG